MRGREQEMTCKVRPNLKLVPGWATGWLVQATNGNFYGTTGGGGPTAAYPTGGLAQATDGTLYGTARGGGANNDGTVFSLAVGLGPFVETVPTSAKVGKPSEFSGPI